MGIFDGYIASSMGRKAYGLHLVGNRLYDQGKADEARAKHEQAFACYQKAMAAGCDKPAYLMAYGVLLLRRRDFEAAREMFLKAERSKALTKEERRQLRINYGICQWKLGNLDQAIEQLTIASREGKTSLIYGSLGYMLIEKGSRTGDFSEALAFNAEALDYDDADAVVLDNMGQLHLRMGERAKAKEFFEKAHEAKPAQVDTLYYLAKLAGEDGERDKALSYLDTALSGNFSALSTISREQAQALKDELEAK